MVKWPWSRTRIEDSWSISDPVFAAYFGVGTNYTGVPVNESTALGLSAFYRAVALISETIAGLQARTLRKGRAGAGPEPVPSFLDDPAGVMGMTPFNFWETVLCHLLVHGDAYLQHIHSAAGSLVGLWPVHPGEVTAEWEKDSGGVTGRKIFKVSGGKEYTQDQMTNIMGKSMDGLCGMSVVTMARNSLGTAIAGDRAAAKMFNTGALHAGMVTPADGEDVTPDEAKAIKEELDQKVAGWENNGSLAVVNRRLKFVPWTMSMEDAQFLQSRAFQIEEVARWFGIPPFALMQTEKQTSWGTGIESQQRGLARTVLAPWTTRIEQQISRLLPAGRYLEFDFSRLERATPAEESKLVIDRFQGGVINRNEARAQLGFEPVEGGDVFVDGGPLAAFGAGDEVPDES